MMRNIAIPKDSPNQSVSCTSANQSVAPVQISQLHMLSVSQLHQCKSVSVSCTSVLQRIQGLSDGREKCILTWCG
ncbi:hypothetical protein Hanom_Chr16g01437621 [Helianthus anomalus]